MDQRKTEWLNIINPDYHDKQFVEPYRSTVKYIEWLSKLGIFSLSSNQKILDVGTGKGANLFYLNRLYPDNSYIGIDINENLISEGMDFMGKAGVANITLFNEDIYKKSECFNSFHFDGVISFQTLSWLPEYEKVIAAMVSSNPDWISFSSLFYEGNVECKIEVSQYPILEKKTTRHVSYYNIYSIPKIKKLLGDYGYKKFYYSPFTIDIDLQKPSNGLMGTYTRELINRDKIQLSGPLLLPWYFILAVK